MYTDCQKRSTSPKLWAASRSALQETRLWKCDREHLSNSYRQAPKTQGNAVGHMAMAISRDSMPIGKSMRIKGGGGRGGKIKGKTRRRIVSPHRSIIDEPSKYTINRPAFFHSIVSRCLCSIANQREANMERPFQDQASTHNLFTLSAGNQGSIRYLSRARSKQWRWCLLWGKSLGAGSDSKDGKWHIPT